MGPAELITRTMHRVCAAVIVALAAASAQGQQIAKLTAGDGAANDWFGFSVSIDGETAVIGARLNDDGASRSGSGYIFRAVGGEWQQIAKLTADDAAAVPEFGFSVSLNGDTAIVGAPLDDDAGDFSGSAYIFREVGGVWQQVAKLTAADAAPGDQFGVSVSLSGDTAVVGAYLDDDAGANSGSAYVFRDDGGVWQQIAKLTAADGAGGFVGDRFGTSVSISGETAVIGANLDDDTATDSGSAYVFRAVGGVWQQIAKLTAADAAFSDRFGTSVSISGDTALIGAHQDDDGGSNSGSAYVFREVDGFWMQIAKLTADNGAANDGFGFRVSIDGDTAIIGAHQDDDAGSNSGSAYIFRAVGGAWQQIAKLAADDAAAGDEFGLGISISGDTAVVGAFLDDDAGQDSGSAYVFAVAPPCPPDLNADGLLDFFDVSAFLNAYSAGEPAADFNSDGLHDFFDLQTFLQAFSAGCP